MKKLITFILAVVLCLSFSLTAYAKTEKETTQDASTPRLMVCDFKVEGKSLTPGKRAKVTVTLKNYSSTKYIKNIKLSVNEESGDIKPVGTGNTYVDTIYANSTYTWSFQLVATQTAQIGEHAVTISSEYEDKYFSSYSGSDIIRINVKQSVGLDYSELQLPAKVYSDETATLDVNLLNTGKSNIRNCKLDFDINGLDSGGASFVGEIPAGDQANAKVNFRVGKELGDVNGTVIITYEDEFGKEYKKKATLSTKIIERPVEPANEEEEQAKYPLWWLFLISGLAVGGGVGCAIPVAVYKSKQRKEDELRL